MESVLIKIYKKVIHGVAFIPLVVMLTLTGAAFWLTAPSDLAQGQLHSLPEYFKIEKVETTRALLSSILTGMIALTVFGFTMMIVVVNQAASLYSPKVVETLLGKKENKIVLGFYLGTIVYTIITLMHIDNKETQQDSHLAVLINIVLQIITVIMFVEFINRISASVRITEIIQDIYTRTKNKMESTERNRCKEAAIDTSDWTTHTAEHSGYFQLVQIKPLVKYLEQEDLMVKVLPYPGEYYNTRTPLFALSKKASEKTVQKIRSYFVSYTGEVIEDNEFYGFRQLREIAVKALSPGVNDPGVARICIDYLGDLLTRWMTVEKNNMLSDKQGTPRLILQRYDFAKLVSECVIPIKIYGKKDFTVINSLLIMFNKLVPYDRENRNKEFMNRQVRAIIEDADRHIENKLERMLVNNAVKELDPHHFQVHEITETPANELPESV